MANGPAASSESRTTECQGVGSWRAEAEGATEFGILFLAERAGGNGRVNVRSASKRKMGAG